MRQRTITATVFAAIMLAGLFGGHYTFLILFGVITAGSLFEFSGLVFDPNSKFYLFRRLATLAIGFIPFVLKSLYTSTTEDAANWQNWLMVVMPIGLFFLLMLAELYMQTEKPFESLGLYLVGLVYIGFPLMLAIWVAHFDGTYHPMRIMGILILTWTNDSMAYMIGSRIGKTPFSPRISPKKTWEGTLGGVVFTIGLAWALSTWSHSFSWAQWMSLAVVVAIFGNTGDLIESLLKRSLGIKDSGNILPGHGGFLDRFDSFIFLLPFAALCIELFK